MTDNSYSLFHQVLYEHSLIVLGEWPIFTCGKGEGFQHRISYTFLGISVGSILFWMWAVYLYSVSSMGEILVCLHAE